MRRSWRVWATVLVLLGVMAAELAGSVRRESVSWDEGDHLFAGWMSLRTGDLGLNPEHPPMAKMVAALPLVGLPIATPRLGHRFFKDEAYFGGRELLFHNGRYPAGTLLFRARMAVSVFALLLALLVFGAGREMFGTGAGLLAMALLVLEPNELAHGAFVTTDAAIACLFFATVWALYRYLSRPSPGRLLLVGLAAGLALAAKHSAVILLPVLVLLLAGEWWMRVRAADRAASLASSPDESPGRRPVLRPVTRPGREALRLAGVLVATGVVALAVLWAFYGFRYAARPDGLRLDPSLAGYVGSLKPAEAKGILLCARLHLLPESWLYGLADVRRVANWMPSFLFGKVYAHGVWGYFPSVLVIKLTLGTMGLVLLAAWAALSGRLRKGRECWFLLLPPAVYLLVAMNAQLNLGMRHVLPVVPFLLVFAAGGAWSLMGRDRRWAVVVALLFVAHAVSSLRAYPDYLPYANEAWGGSSETYKHLTDSNADWGQQLLSVSAYLKKNGIRDCWFGYFVAPFVEPADYGVPCRLLPTFDTSNEVDLDVPSTVGGVVLMSAGDENGFEFGTRVRNPYQALMGRKPDAVIDGGVLVFRGTFAFPLAAAIAPTQRSMRLLKAGDAAGAVREAETAVRVAPGSFDAWLQLGDAERKLGDAASAREAYRRARALVGAMEPSAQELWRPQLDAKLAGVG